MADRLQLVHELCMREKLRDRPEGKTPEVLVETGDDDTCAPVGQLEGCGNDRLLEELQLLPLNIGPQMTSSHPPRCGGIRITAAILRV